ncbi:MATE family efflux transporter [Microbispora sp. NPDC088329]|uniref:MATE family efflux transporter n=1 Tax=unclassified Microbispora TaxID=2614687 RepID=UPI0034395368
MSATATAGIVDGRPSALGLLRLGLPMAGAMAATLAGSFVVLAILARAGGDDLYLRSVYVPISLVYTAVMAGLSVSAQVAAAVRTGAGDPAGAGRFLTGFLYGGLAAYAALGALLVAGSAQVAGLVGMGAADEPAFRAFVRAMALVMLFPLIGEVLAAALRGTGATGQGSAVSLTYLVVEVAGVYLLSSVAGWGIMAVPVAVAAAGIVQCVLGVLLTRRRGVRPAAGHGWWQPAVGRMFVRIGAPVAVSYLVLFALNLGYVRMLAPFGPQTVAGFSLAYTLQTLIVVPGIGFGSAVAIAMNQARGAGRPELARRVLWLGMRVAAAGYVLIVLAVVLGGDVLMTTVAADPAVAGEARNVLAVIAPTWACMGCTLTGAAVLEETGHGLAALAGNLLWAVAVLVAGWALVSAAAGPAPLYQTMAVANVAGLVLGAPLAMLLMRGGKGQGNG